VEEQQYIFQVIEDHRKHFNALRIKKLFYIWIGE
jgi:hypothetical protein